MGETMTTECQRLLTEYVGDGSEPAFRELVGRYIDFVYSTARRLVGGDAHLAEDVAQTVFIDLARKAHTISSAVMLGGWLHRRTVHVAATMQRSERRRQHHERQAMEMELNAREHHSEANLAQVAPVLDEAIEGLEAEDRAAILLRFFEQRDYRTVAEALGINEDAARMRVRRALDKLHGLLTCRGVTLSAAALGTALATGTVEAAPSGLAASIAATALAKTAGAGFTLTLLKVMTMTRIKAGILATVVVAGMAATLAVQHQSQTRLREENRSLRRGLDQMAQVMADNERLLNHLAEAGTSVREERMSELLRLRNEVGRLRQQTNNLGRLLAENGEFGSGGASNGAGPVFGAVPALLSQEDRAAIDEATRAEMSQLGTDLQAAQKAAVEAALSGASGADLEAKLDPVAQLQTQMALVYCKAANKVVKFTDEQTSRMKETPEIGYMNLFIPHVMFGGVPRGA